MAGLLDFLFSQQQGGPQSISPFGLLAGMGQAPQSEPSPQTLELQAQLNRVQQPPQASGMLDPTPMGGGPLMPRGMALQPPASGFDGISPDMPASGAMETGPVAMPPQRPMPGPPMQLQGAAPAMPPQQPGPMPGAPQQQQQAGQSGFDKFFDVIGSIYGKGGPGDNLIALGAGLASGGGNWGQGLMRGMSMINANNLTAKKKDEDARRSQGRETSADLIAQRLGIPREQALGVINSGMGNAMMQQAFTKQTPQLVSVDNPDGTKRQEWVIPGQPVPGQSTGQAMGGAAPSGTADDGRTVTLADGTKATFPGGNFNQWRDALTKETAEVTLRAPGAFSKLKQSYDTVARLAANKSGLDMITSPVGSVAEMIPGSSARNARSQIDQVLGQSFLSAFESLKGGGAITEKEGAKAEAAMARLKDPRIGGEQYREALKEYTDALREGMEKLRKVQTVTGDLPPPIDFGIKAPAAPASSGGGARILRRLD